MSLNIPASSFYQKNKNKRLLDIEEKLEHAECQLKRKPIPQDFPISLLGPPANWKIFTKQDEALNYAQKNGMGLMTFAFEERVPDSGGRRKYLTTHPSQMWIRHKSRPIEERCTYEVIPQSSKCKLYFDLEFSKPLNPQSSGEKMVELLIKATTYTMQEVFDAEVTESDILILDGTTETKFSQHLIFQSQNAVFQDNIHAGSFVQYLVNQLKESKVPNLSATEQQSLFINNDKGNTVSLCDLGVYTKNRNFRLFLSTKFGKNVPLIIAKNNSFRPALSNNEALFNASLISYFEDEKSVHQLLTFAKDVSGKSKHHDQKSLDPTLNGYKMSPWNEIDDFIMKLATPGTIHHWVYYEQSETIVYVIQGNRYCSSIGREHKRNQIKYVVNLPNATYYQTCFDPDCTRGVTQTIPPEYLPWHNLMGDLDAQTPDFDSVKKTNVNVASI